MQHLAAVKVLHAAINAGSCRTVTLAAEMLWAYDCVCAVCDTWVGALMAAQAQ